VLIKKATAVLLLLGTLILFLGPAAAAGVALASGDWASALAAFAPLSVLPLGFLAFGLLSSLRRVIARHSTRGRLVPTDQTFGFPILRVAAWAHSKSSLHSAEQNPPR
jgi:hypothetical protein